MNDPTMILDQFAAKACRLYSLPAVAMKVLELTENPQVDTRALKQCIETDPALTGKVLRVVNSSLYGLSRQVSDLNQALALLGTKPLKLLVLGFSLPPGLFDGLEGGVLLQYWRHTLVKAVAAREVCELLSKRRGDEAFIAGLLQDLGVLLLIQELGEPYVKFLETFTDRGDDAAALERESLGFDRTQLSARLLAHWRLPRILVDAVALSAPEDQGPSDEAVTMIRRVLRVAELVACLLAGGRERILPVLMEEGRSLFGLTEEGLETLVGNLDEKVRQLADALSVEWPPGVDSRDLLAEAHRRLAEAAAEAAGELVAYRAGIEGASERDDPIRDLLENLADKAGQAAREPLPAAPELKQPAAATGAPGGVAARSQGTMIASAHLPGPGIVAAAATSLAGYVGAAAAACRRSRVPLSLMLVEMVHPEAYLLTRGKQRLIEARGRLEQICRAVDHPLRACLPRGQSGFALILSDCERQAAVRLGQQVIEAVRRLDIPGGMAVSVGLAAVSLPPVNFDPERMLESADRCLYGAHASGGSVVKSIEIY